jgi:hypothetical protein
MLPATSLWSTNPAATRLIRRTTINGIHHGSARVRILVHEQKRTLAYNRARTIRNAGRDPSPPQHSHGHAHTRPIAVHIHIKTRKNDQKGRGHTLHFHLAHHTDKYCYVSEVWAHAQGARPKPHCPFFAIPSENWALKAPQLSLQLKNMAVYLGIDYTRISTHFLRIDGASTLAAAGLTDNEIMRIGAWRSTTFLTYIWKNSQLFEKARAALAGSGAMTLSDVKRFDTANTTRVEKTADAQSNKRA